MTRQRMRMWMVGATGLLAFAVSSCVDEKVVYRDQQSFTTPPAAAADFLGYSDQVTKTTVCGNCHAGQQGTWATTKHASAWADLQASGHASGACEACHTVNNQGNIVTDTAAGWRSTKDTRYYDVQCEACHGPGLNHVTAPQRGQMLASIHADTGAAITNGCAECHQGVASPVRRRVAEVPTRGAQQPHLRWRDGHVTRRPVCSAHGVPRLPRRPVRPGGVGCEHELPREGPGDDDR